MKLRIIHIWTDDGTEHVFWFFIQPEEAELPAFEPQSYVEREERPV